MTVALMRYNTLPLFLMLLAGCQYDPYAQQFTTNQPEASDVHGEYILAQQTISSGGLAILGGRECALYLHEDGRFVATNYPTWKPTFTDGSGQFAEFLSSTGRWSCQTVGTVSDGSGSRSTWGIRVDATDRRLKSDHFTLTGSEPPYGLIMTYGDPDAGTVLIFRRRP